MVWVHIFWVQTDVTFSALENGPSSTLLTLRILRLIFHNPTWFKVSSFILVPVIPEVLSDCAGRFLLYFPRLSSISSRKNFNNGTLFPWIPCKIISKKSPQLHLLTKQKKATIAFWNRLGHDKLTRTGRMNEHFPYLHYTPWKDLTLVRLHVFFSFRPALCWRNWI